jgi:hypothetical protein
MNLLLAGGAVFFIAPRCVEAQQEIETVSITPGLSTGSSVNIPRFDPSLGTLESVTVSLVGTGEFVQKFENLNPSSGGQINSEQTLQLVLAFGEGSFIPPLSTQNQQVLSQYTVGAFNGTFNFAGTSGAASSTAVSLDGTATIQSPYLNWFTGQGMASLYLSENTTASVVTEDSQLVAEELIYAGANIAVTYDFQETYSALPEPRLWAAASLVLLGGAWVARSRQT